MNRALAEADSLVHNADLRTGLRNSGRMVPHWPQNPSMKAEGGSDRVLAGDVEVDGRMYYAYWKGTEAAVRQDNLV